MDQIIRMDQIIIIDQIDSNRALQSLNSMIHYDGSKFEHQIITMDQIITIDQIEH